MIKQILSILFLLCFNFLANAQEFIELNVSPNFSYRFLNSENSNLQDSLNNADHIRASVGYGVSSSFNLNKSTVLTTGFKYNDYGFTRIWEDLQFHDVVHPDIGRIEDLSQAAQKDAFFYHKFKYLDIPLRLNFQISKKKNQQDFRIYASTGLTAQIFLEENFKVFFKGFSVGGERIYKNIPTGYDMRSFNVAWTGGTRFIIRISPDFWVTASPEFSIPLLHHTNDGLVNFRLIQFAGNFGIARVLN